MPDLMVRGISDALAEQIKRHAREQGMTLNQAVLHLLELGLRGPSTAGLSAPMQELRILGGTWSAEEAQAFREALNAIERLQD